MSRAFTVAFHGLEARLIEVQCAISAGPPHFSLVGLADKAVTEARERIRAALHALSIALPARRITINLSPADLPKEGSHFDLPITLALLSAIEILPPDEVEGVIALAEMALDGTLMPANGLLAAALTAVAEGKALICARSSAPEAAWVARAEVFGFDSLAQTLAHILGQSPAVPSRAAAPAKATIWPDLSEVRGQERAKRALEIAAAGRHNLLMIGPPGAGKSMLAQRLPGLLPPMQAREVLESALIRSIAGTPGAEVMTASRPYRAPHHSASAAALCGGGRHARPGEISLAHNGVLFLDELPEFNRAALEALRQPIESGEMHLARAEAHLRYPARFQLIAAANPCRCGYLQDANRACSRAPLCGESYLGKISGPLFDRFDLFVDLPAVDYRDLTLPAKGPDSATVRARVEAAQARQWRRGPAQLLNADLVPDALEEVARPDPAGQALLDLVAERRGLSARGYHRVLRVARTIADLAAQEKIDEDAIAEALSYRLDIPSLA